MTKTGLQSKPKLLTFSEFTSGASNSNGGKKNELKEVQKIRTSAKVSLPVQLTFRRVELRTFSDGKVVGLYREPALGFQIVFPFEFGR